MERKIKRVGVGLFIPSFIGTFLYIGISCTIVGVPLLFITATGARTAFIAVLIPVLALLGALVHFFVVDMPHRALLQYMIILGDETVDRDTFISRDLKDWLTYVGKLKGYVGQRHRGTAPWVPGSQRDEDTVLPPQLSYSPNVFSKLATPGRVGDTAIRTPDRDTDATLAGNDSAALPVAPTSSLEHHTAWVASQIERLDTQFPSQSVISTTYVQKQLLRELLTAFLRVEKTVLGGADHLIQGTVTELVPAVVQAAGNGQRRAHTSRQPSGNSFFVDAPAGIGGIRAVLNKDTPMPTFTPLLSDSQSLMSNNAKTYTMKKVDSVEGNGPTVASGGLQGLLTPSEGPSLAPLAGFGDVPHPSRSGATTMAAAAAAAAAAPHGPPVAKTDASAAVFQDENTNDDTSTASLSSVVLSAPSAAVRGIVLERGGRFTSDSRSVFFVVTVHKVERTGAQQSSIFGFDATFSTGALRRAAESNSGSRLGREPFRAFYLTEVSTPTGTGGSDARRSLTIAEDRMLGMECLGPEAPRGSDDGDDGGRAELDLTSLAVPVTPRPGREAAVPDITTPLRVPHTAKNAGKSPPLEQQPGTAAAAAASPDAFILMWNLLPDIPIRLTTLQLMTKAAGDASAPQPAQLPVAECLVQDVLCIVTKADVYIARNAFKPHRVVVEGVSVEDVSSSSSGSFLPTTPGSTPREKKTSTPQPAEHRQHCTVGKVMTQEFQISPR